MVVEENPAADDTLLGPGVDAIDVGFLYAVGAVDMVKGDAVVEFGFSLVPEMPEAVPLGGGLGVEGPDVVIYNARGFLVDFFVELLAAEEGEVGLGVEGPVDVDAGAALDFFGCFFYDVVG